MALASSFGIGIGRVPEHTGSKDYRLIPLASFKAETRLGTVSNDQIGIKIDLSKSRTVDTGPLIRYDGGRKRKSVDERLRNLEPVPATIEVGWFISSGLPLSVLGLPSNAIATASLRGVTDVQNGHGGSRVQASVGMVKPVNETISVIGSLSANWADGQYMDAFYGIDESADVPADIEPFTADSGIESVGVSVIINKSISDLWSITGISSYSLLQGDAKSSPISSLGSNQSTFFGIVLNRTY